MDFYQICTKEVEAGPRKGTLEIYPDFIVGRSKDLMVRGKSFYAIWDEEKGLWSTDEYDVQRLVDAELRAFAEKYEQSTGAVATVKYLRSYSNRGWAQFRNYLQNVSDNSVQLDAHLTFANTTVKKSDHVSRRLPYALDPGDHSAWDELVGTLYSVDERAKIEWAIGAIVAGDSKKMQKFLVFYGPPGTGKSTILDVVEKLFDGYTTTFDAKALGSSGATFATEVFKNNPLVAIQHDGDLSRIDDNARLNSIISHEMMPMNEKYKAGYSARVNSFLLMGTNQPVKISDAKSGLLRRLIDVHPTGVKIPTNHYFALMSKIDFELGAIAAHCLDTYQSMGKNYYNNYRPTEMMFQTDIFFNFIEAHYDLFKEQNGSTLKQAYSLYKEFCKETGIERPLPAYKVREELRNYFDDFKERIRIEGEEVRSYYKGFNAEKFKIPVETNGKAFSLVLDETESIFDEQYAFQPAQYGTRVETPKSPWALVTTRLEDIDTTKLHFVKVPEHHIIIDFDLKDQNGTKALERNLEAASVWPPTYAEISKSGNGVHLHYNYEGDVSELSSSYSDGIEVKTLLGDASLRRRLTKANRISVATLPIGTLPLKEKRVLSDKVIKSEKGLRELIDRNFKKDVHPSTVSSISFIKKILDEAYETGMSYDVSDLHSKLIAFANNSSNQPLRCLKMVQEMKLKSEVEPPAESVVAKDDRIVFFDLEVYINLFVICWKFKGAPDESIVRMVNPTPVECEALLGMKLVGFNNRRYDNHILYARTLGYDNEALYKLSQKIINGDRNAMYGAAYNISYTDIYDFSSKKQGLKKFEIELGLKHKEMDIPWDQPVPIGRVQDVVDYCCNDVFATEATFEARMQDFTARQILADVSGLSVNDTTQRHTAKIVFGDDRRPQDKFVYTHLSEMFPGYSFDPRRKPKSEYRGEDPSEGGYVYAEPGMYENVAVLDIASMHPTSIEQLNMFGPYTKNFSALKAARIAIKHGDYDSARTMLGGKLKPHLEDPSQAQALSYALKIVINIVYGLTSAKFENPFKDLRNIDNIVAKRGALFMIDLKLACQEKGLTVAHIKTDSIKIPNATPEDIEEIMNFGEKYGYTFEHEATYEKFCLVNDAVYIARKQNGDWEAVGAQFQHPYVFKKLFSGEPIEFDDMCETKQVTKGAMYLDFHHDAPEKMLERMSFIGRTGRFVPVLDRGGVLYRHHEDKFYAVTGTKGYLWMDAEVARELGDEIEIDTSYFEEMMNTAYKTIEKFGDFETFVR